MIKVLTSYSGSEDYELIHMKCSYQCLTCTKQDTVISTLARYCPSCHDAVQVSAKNFALSAANFVVFVFLCFFVCLFVLVSVLFSF